MKVDDSRRGYLGMARARPEKVKEVLGTLRQLGPLSTFRKVMNRLDSFTPLGYSLAGQVIDVAADISDLEVGDMVACGGGELATHAEVNWIPRNLCAKIPRMITGPREGEFVPVEHAAFATVGSIAMQGVRQAAVQVGERVAVIGLGLVGLLASEILKAAGCTVLGFDIDHRKVTLARSLGIEAVTNSDGDDPVQVIESFTNGYGADAVLITTGTKSNRPIEIAGMIARDRATIVDIGINKMDVPWQLYYSKELVLRQSRSYGPGRYDLDYEVGGKDYPIGYVRWTENRNMQSVLELIASGRIDVSPLVTHRFDFDRAGDAYKLIAGSSDEFYVGILLDYDVNAQEGTRLQSKSLEVLPRGREGNLGLGVIGAGNFARTMLLPHLKRKDVELISVATATGISARDAARKFGFRTCTTDYRELLRDDAIEAVIIATRHNLHGPLVKEALQAGKNVYTEKPLCINTTQLEEIASVYDSLRARGAPPLLTVGFNRRFAPMVRQMKDFFHDRRGPMVVTCRVNAGTVPRDSWYQDPAVGGGRIVGEVCHFVDTLQYLCGAQPVRVTAHSVETDNRAVVRADNFIATFEFTDGSVGSIAYVATGDPSFPKEYFEAFADKKVAVLDNYTRLLTMSGGRRQLSRAAIQDKGHKAEMRHLVSTLTGGNEDPIGFASIYSTTMATLKILEALDGNTAVTVPLWS
jgi:polar amino acid transport system substrate-binding protein